MHVFKRVQELQAIIDQENDYTMHLKLDTFLC